MLLTPGWHGPEGHIEITAVEKRCGKILSTARWLQHEARPRCIAGAGFVIKGTTRAYSRTKRCVVMVPLASRQFKV